MSNYRAAKCIELHDSNIALTTREESYAFTALTGRTEHAEKSAFSVRFCDIKMLAQMFGVEVSDTVVVPAYQDQTCAESGKRSEIDYLEFPVYKVHHDYSDSISPSNDMIVKLECEIISNRLVNIRTTFQDSEEPEPYIEEITYCGPFTIWWAKA